MPHEPAQALRADAGQAQQGILHTQGGDHLVDVGQGEQLVPGQVTRTQLLFDLRTPTPVCDRLGAGRSTLFAGQGGGCTPDNLPNRGQRPQRLPRNLTRRPRDPRPRSRGVPRPTARLRSR